MGLKFERTDDLEKLFDSFAIDPTAVDKPEEEQQTDLEEDEEETTD